MSDKSQQTEKPTQKRVEKARKEGQFPAAKDLVSAVQFVVFVAVLGSAGPRWIAQFRLATRIIIERAFHAELTAQSLVSMFWFVGAHQFLPLAELGGVLLISALVVQFAVTRFGFSFSKLAPSFNRLNPGPRITGLPKQNFPALIQACLMLPLVGYAVWYVARDKAAESFLLPMRGVEAGAATVGAGMQQLLWRGTALIVVFGFVNFFRQQRQYASQMKMSKQQIKDEAKESEGNPQMKQRVRRLQRDMRRRNMMRDVNTATAVIVNPTHFAVAIKYSTDSMAAPTVVAKGKNYLALRIRQRAIENQIPIIENPPLAQALYKSVDVGQEIPAHLYRAVAEILAYIYKLMNGKLPS